MDRIGPAAMAAFFLYSGESLLSSGLVPGGPAGAPPGVVAGFRGEAVFGPDIEVRPAPGDIAEFRPLVLLSRSVFSRGRAPFAGLSRASGGDREGKLMTCSRNGTE